MKTKDYKQEYLDLLPFYQKLTRKNTELLRELLECEGIKATIESRTKNVESLYGKITRPGKAYKDPLKEISDLSGIRIILYSLADVEKATTLIHKNFIVDKEKSVNKLEELAPDKFGYISQHYIVKTIDTRKNLPEWKGITEYWCEIQIRTVLQHAWAAVNHFLLYKNEYDAPKALRRRLFRLSALFELADEELVGIICDIQTEVDTYRKEFNEGNKSVEINIESLKTFIQTSPEAQYWIKFLREKTKQRVDDNDWGDLSRDVRFAHYFGLNSIEKLEQLLKEAHGWGEEFFVEYYQEYIKLYDTTPDKVSTVINGPATILMIASNTHKIDADILEKDFGWGGGELLIDNANKARGIS